jgi:formylglycine-generating enzyme required for sulfatase activity
MRKLIVVASVAAGLLTGCDQGNTTGSEKAAKALVDKSVSNMVPVQGGEFLMGDFGPLVGEKLPFSIQQDDKGLHKVILSDFSISKYKVTNDDFNVYLKVKDKKIHPWIYWQNVILLLKGDYPAGVIWQQAKDYCQWLGKNPVKKLICRQRRNGSLQQGPEVSIFRLLLTMVSFHQEKMSQARMN